MLPPPNSTFLFQGDSITDCQRERNDPTSLGQGYAMMTASLFAATAPSHNVSFLNRGISGNRTGDLLGRWQQDCIDLQPHTVSLLIGINDVWRRYDRNMPTTTEEYEANVHQLLQRTRDALPDTRIIILEPFLCPTPPDRIPWREDLDPKIDALRRVARTFQTRYVPLDGIFAAASTRQPPAYWAGDGVHPTPEGHALIAKALLQTLTSPT